MNRWMDDEILGKWMEGQWDGWVEGRMIGYLMEESAMGWLEGRMDEGWMFGW